MITTLSKSRVTSIIRSVRALRGGLATVMFAAGVVLAGGADSSEGLARLRREYSAAKAAYESSVKGLPDTPEGKKQARDLYAMFDQKQAEVLTGVVQLAQAEPASEVAFSALEWRLLEPRTYHLPAGPAALELMGQYHAKRPDIGKLISILGYYFPLTNAPSYSPSLSLIQSVAEKNPSRVARGHAALALAWLAKREAEEAEWENKPNAQDLATKTEMAFEAVIRDYGDCTYLRTIGVRPAKKTLGQEAASELNELRFLRVGKVAPDTEGKDLNGVPFKLTDYHGKVVMLVFWAAWCGPCVAAIPHENEIAARFKDRPFVLLGVNGDPSKADALSAVTKHKVTWRSFWNGKEGPGGPIATAWNVRGWPTVFVIDQHGVIRHKDGPVKGLEGLLETMVVEAEKHAAKKG